MRIVVLLVMLFLLFLQWGTRRPSGAALVIRAPAASDSEVPVDFARQVKPILQSKCMPCHFSGGQMYERLPFDQPQTVRKLGVRLFTRIQDEEQRRVIRKFLAQKD